MFSEWTDPNDIDNYYNDLEGMFKDIQAAPSSSIYYQPPVKQKAPEAPPTKANDTSKSAFVPFPADGMQSGRTDGMCNGYTMSLIPDTWWIYAVVFIVFLFIVGTLIHHRSQLKATKMTLQVVLAMWMRQEQAKQA